MKDDSKVAALAAVFLLGTVVGLALGFLLAPHSGMEMRKKLSNEAGIAKEKLLEKGQEAWARLKHR